jgi:hypothetical protein
MKKKRQERKEEKIQRKSKKPLIYAIIFLSIIILVGFSLYMMFFHSSSEDGFSFEAAIIDQLGITYKNDTFRERATSMLKQAGYSTVDYYDYTKVTVEFYRNLPQHDYGLIILRTHSETEGTNVCFFTSEQNKTQYGYSLVLSYLNETGKWYYGIPPKFVESHMNGKFRNAIFIVTGCGSAKYRSMADALFESRGAKAYIGWNGPLRVDLADNTTIYLLKTLLENQTIKDAVERVNSKISGNTNYGSKLTCYLKSEDFVIPRKVFAVWVVTFLVPEKVGFSISRNVSKQLHEAGLEGHHQKH